jgi:hypothetical protein
MENKCQINQLRLRCREALNVFINVDGTSNAKNLINSFGLVSELGKDKKVELRERNITEINSFNWINWQSPSLFRTYVLNACINTMGVSAENGDMQKAIRFAYGDAELDKRTGNTGFTIEYGSPTGKFRTVVPIESVIDKNADFNDASPILVTGVDDQGRFSLDVNEKAKVPARIVKAPSWYNDKYQIDGQDFYASKLVQWENGVLMLSVPEKNGKQVCAYLGKEENACTFCGLEQGAYKPLTPEILVDIVRKDLEQSSQTSLTLTGGNTFDSNRGFEKYVPFVEALREEFGKRLPIQLEVSPPSDQGYLNWIVDQQLSFMANIEVWEDSVREVLIPAKAKSIPREEYLETFKFLNRKGVDTYSVLITSLQPFEDLVKGTKRLAEIGTSTVVLPFRPNGGVLSNYTPTRATDLLTTSIASAEIMNTNGVFLDQRPKEYCSGCGGCGVDANLRDNPRLLKNNLFQEFKERNGAMYSGGIK